MKSASHLVKHRFGKFRLSEKHGHINGHVEDAALCFEAVAIEDNRLPDAIRGGILQKMRQGVVAFIVLPAFHLDWQDFPVVFKDEVNFPVLIVP